MTEEKSAQTEEVEESGEQVVEGKPRKTTHIDIHHDDDEKDEHVHLNVKVTPEAIDLKGMARLARDPNAPGFKEFGQKFGPLLAKVGAQMPSGGPAGTSAENDVTRVPPQAAREARPCGERIRVTDAQKALLEVLRGLDGLEAVPPEFLCPLEAHLRRRLPQLRNLVRLLELPAEDPMLDPIENARARILGAVHHAGEAGIPVAELEKVVGTPDVFREVLGSIIEDGRVRVDQDDRVFWVSKPGEEVNDLGVLNSVYDGQKGTPTPSGSTTP